MFFKKILFRLFNLSLAIVFLGIMRNNFIKISLDFVSYIKNILEIIWQKHRTKQFFF